MFQNSCHAFEYKNAEVLAKAVLVERGIITNWNLYRSSENEDKYFWIAGCSTKDIVSFHANINSAILHIKQFHPTVTITYRKFEGK